MPEKLPEAVPQLFAFLLQHPTNFATTSTSIYSARTIYSQSTSIEWLLNTTLNANPLSAPNFSKMTVSVICLYTRRADISPAEFQRYMEEVHVPIQKEVMGEHFPISYPRRYVARIESGAGDRLGAPSASKKTGNPSLPVVLVGSPEELGWDLLAEMVYRDELHMQQCYAAINTLDGQRMKDDEENFTESSQLKVVLMSQNSSS